MFLMVIHFILVAIIQEGLQRLVGWTTVIEQRESCSKLAIHYGALQIVGDACRRGGHAKETSRTVKILCA